MRRWFAVLFALWGFCALGAQDAAPQPASAPVSGFGRPRYMVFLFEAEEDTLSPEQNFLLYNSILSAVAEANKDVVILESPDPSVPRTKEGREELARRVNADSWLSVVASGGFQNLTIEADIFDILRQESTGHEIIRPGFVVDSRTIARGFWDGIVTDISKDYSRIVDFTTLTVHGRPGTELVGVPGGPYRIDSTGTLVEKIPYPSVFLLRARAAGVYVVERPLTLGIDKTEVDLGQVSKPWVGVEASLSSLQFPMVRVWGSIIPALVFVRMGVSTQMIGLYPIDNAQSVLVTGSPLSFLSLDAGVYVLPAENFFRLYVAAGGYLRFSHSPGHLGLDNDGAPGAITATVGAEYSPSRRIRFLLAYEPALIFASDPQRFIKISFVTNSYPSGQVPGYVVLPWGLIDLRNVYVGMRADF
jgi:hypothetical protein